MRRKAPAQVNQAAVHTPVDQQELRPGLVLRTIVDLGARTINMEFARNGTTYSLELTPEATDRVSVVCRKALEHLHGLPGARSMTGWVAASSVGEAFTYKKPPYRSAEEAKKTGGRLLYEATWSGGAIIKLALRERMDADGKWLEVKRATKKPNAANRLRYR